MRARGCISRCVACCSSPEAGVWSPPEAGSFSHFDRVVSFSSSSMILSISAGLPPEAGIKPYAGVCMDRSNMATLYANAQWHQLSLPAAASRKIARSSPLALSLHASRARQWLWNLQQPSHIHMSSSLSAKDQPTHRTFSSQWTAFWASSAHRSKACPPKWTGSASGMKSKIGYHFGILLRDHPPIIFCAPEAARQEAGDTSSQHLKRNGIGLSVVGSLSRLHTVWPLQSCRQLQAY